ncbi:hypothetical protein [Xanthocytophaga agilis]|uniref:hypothetical protein n=1 Tax=Xanthocytophaga agilis TaxID=3048010 RepID=UPI0028D8207E|nr:hypothetical protein [Xanthocytophaga agilis]
MFIIVSFPEQTKAQTEVAFPDTLAPVNAQGAQIPLRVPDPSFDQSYSAPQKQGSLTIVTAGAGKDSVKLYVHRKKPKPDEHTSRKFGRLSLWTTVSAYIVAFLSLELTTSTLSLIIGIGAILLAITGAILGIKSLNGTHKTKKSRIPAMLGFFFSLMMLVAFATAITIWMYTP